jgi:hypothetical protein
LNSRRKKRGEKGCKMKTGFYQLHTDFSSSREGIPQQIQGIHTKKLLLDSSLHIKIFYQLLLPLKSIV